MALAHVKFDEPDNFGYTANLLRNDDGTDRGPVIGVNVQLRQHHWHYIWPWREYGRRRWY